jgi:F-type H+-transporting ATPase subunit a|tara:strand:- start:1577 stop:2422 length:846 start_codon:yes stop_codon:yes gene_type:complete
LAPVLFNILAAFSASSGSGGEGQADPFETLFAHVVPQTSFHGLDMPYLFGLQVFDIQLFQLLAMVLLVVFFAPVRSAVANGTGGRVTKIFAGWVTWLRDEVVVPNVGEKDGRRLLPLFLTLFFFIAFMNLLGLIPGGLSATASVYTAAGLSMVTLIVMVAGGMIVQGPIKFWISLVPSGVPVALVPMLFVLEVLGLIIKPFALTMRLMANMTGGHLVLLSFLGLMFFFGQDSTAVGFAVSPLVVGMSVFMMIIEGFVALLQAYVFTLLSAIFVGMCLHPDH